MRGEIDILFFDNTRNLDTKTQCGHGSKHQGSAISVCRDKDSRKLLFSPNLKRSVYPSLSCLSSAGR
jgi:hypothetical protein